MQKYFIREQIEKAKHFRLKNLHTIMFVSFTVDAWFNVSRGVVTFSPIHHEPASNIGEHTHTSDTVYRIRQNFRGGKLSLLCTKRTIHWKIFAVHQVHAIMYCTRQMIQGENFRDC